MIFDANFIKKRVLKFTPECWFGFIVAVCIKNLILVWLLILAPTMAYCLLFNISAIILRPEKYNSRAGGLGG